MGFNRFFPLIGRAFFLVSWPLGLASTPIAPEVVAGQADFIHEGNHHLKIATQEMKTVIHWDTFSLAPDDCVHFAQPHVDAVTLNRVTSSLTSEIFGTLTSNGFLYLINPAGILIGPGGIIDVNGFLASTLDVTDRDFLTKETLLFSGNSEATLVHKGTICAQDGGIVLLGRYIVNQGDLVSLRGATSLGAGTALILNTKTQGIFVQPDLTNCKPSQTGIDNQGTIEAMRVDLRADGALYAAAIRQTGSIQAMTTCAIGGEIYLVAEGGTTSLQQKAHLIAHKKGGQGGVIHILGRDVSLEDHAHLVSKNESSGGEIFIGGSLGGKDLSLPAAQTTLIGKDVVLDASCSSNGQGGSISIFGAMHAELQGKALAQGGPQGGDGGVIDISRVPFFTGAVIDTTAPCGQTGMFILDPTNITLSNNATTNMMLAGSTYAGTAASANLNADDLNTALSTTNITVTTASAFGSAGNITITDPISLTVASSRSLTLLANNTMTINSGDSLTFIDNGAGISELILHATGSIVINGSLTTTNITRLDLNSTGGNVNLNGPVVATNAQTVTVSAGAMIDLDNSFTAEMATVTLSATTIDAGGTNSLVANQCAVNASNIILDALSAFSGNGAGSMLSFTASSFQNTASVTFNDWESVAISVTANASLDASIAANNVSTLDISAGNNIDLDNTITASSAAVTLTAATFNPGGANSLSADQCTLTATNSITLDQSSTFIGNGPASSFSLSAATTFINTGALNLSNWGVARCETQVGNFTIDNAINVTAVDALFLISGSNILNQNGTNTLLDQTGQRTHLTLNAAGNVLINSQININNFASCTINANNDFILNNDFEPNGTLNVAVTAGNNIFMINSSADVVATNGNSLSFTAGNMFASGEPFQITSVDEVSITAINGPVTIGAGSNFSLANVSIFNVTSRNNNVTFDLNTTAIPPIAGTGQINLSAPNGDLFVLDTSLINVATGDITLIAGGNITLQSNTEPALVGTSQGTVSIQAGQNLTLTGGPGSGDRAHIGFGQGSFANSDIELTVGGNITLTAGTNSNTVALIGHGFNSVSGNYHGDIIFHAVGGHVTLTGGPAGSGSVKYAQIGHTRAGGSPSSQFSGDIRGTDPNSFAVITGALSLTGGGDTESFALFGHGGQNSAAVESYTGAIRVQAETITLNSGGTALISEAAIGYFGAAQTGSGGSMMVNSGVVEVISNTDIVMTANSNNGTAIGGRILNIPANTVSINLDLVRVQTAGDLMLTSGSLGVQPDATIGALTTSGSATASVLVEVGGDLTLQAGTAAPAQIINGNVGATNDQTMRVNVAGNLTHSFTGAEPAQITAVSGSLTVEVNGTVTLPGDLGVAPSLAWIENLGGSNGTLRVTGGDILVQSGAFIRNSGTGTTSVETTTGGCFLFNSSFIFSQGNLSLTTATDLSLSDNASCTVTAGRLTATTGRNLSIAGSTTGPSLCSSSDRGTYLIGATLALSGVSALSEGFLSSTAGAIEVIANQNIEINPFGRISTLSAETLRLVVDNQAPVPPAIGTGSFSLSLLGSISTAGDSGTVRIFTARRSQNSIAGTMNLNGATFTPGPLFVDSATERWGTYFPSPFGGVPFTLFYKETAVAPIVIPTLTSLLATDGNALTPFFELFYLLDRPHLDPVVAWLYTLPIDSSKLCTHSPTSLFCEADPIASTYLPPYIERLTLDKP